MFTVKSLLASKTDHLDKTIDVLGVLAGRLGVIGSFPWYLVASTSPDFEPRNSIVVETSYFDNALELGFSAIPPVTYELDDPLLGYHLFDETYIRGKLYSPNNLSSEIGLEIEQAEIRRKQYTCYLRRGGVTFEQMNGGNYPEIQINELSQKVEAYAGKDVRLKGFLWGNDLLDLFYVTSMAAKSEMQVNRDAWSIESPLLQSQAILINQRPFFDNLIAAFPPAIETEFMWQYEVSIVGTIESAPKAPFVAFLTSVKEVFLKSREAIFHLNILQDAKMPK